MADIPQRQRERADFLIQLLGTQAAKDTAKQLGYTDHAFLRRLQRNLTEYASIADAPRQGRARTYTDELLGQARDHMMGEEHYVWSMQEFVSSLIEEGIVESGTSVAAFWEAFAPYMQQQGLRWCMALSVSPSPWAAIMPVLGLAGAWSSSTSSRL